MLFYDFIDSVQVNAKAVKTNILFDVLKKLRLEKSLI